MPEMRTEEATVRTADGKQLLERSWLPEGAPNALVAIVHGYAEHSGRYHHVAQRLVANGYAVYAFDLRGHGGSEGRRVLVRAMDEHVADLASFLARVRERGPGLPLYLLGHSMGGTIVTLFLISGHDGVSGAILSGAALQPRRGLASVTSSLIALLGRLVPRLPLGKLGSETISRDPAVVERYDSDPLVYRGRMPAGTVSALIRAIRIIDARMEAITLPLLILHGTSDELTDPDGSRRLYERARSSDKTLKLYDGLFHEVLNEPEQDEVLADIVAWLDARVASDGHGS